MHIRAILFDLHHTLTATASSPWELYRKIASENGADISSFSDEEIKNAFYKPVGSFNAQQVEMNVEPEWGGLPEHWLEADRIALGELGFADLDDEVILNIEKVWMHETARTDWEFFTPESIKTIPELKKRGFALGICTRRHLNPDHLMKRSGMSEYFEAVEYSGVPGYAKPSPFTLFRAADKIGVNPKMVAFIGNWVNSDIDAANRAGMLPILLTWADSSEADKAPDGTIILETPLDLLDIFKNPEESIHFP
jgi:HAD superfamily hydrolase (TIGR01549 family)